ncbi:MAG: FHIPEP family type III secretion protein, partial [Clostridia bacterium]
GEAPAPRLWAQLVQRPSVFYLVAGVLVLLVFFGMPPLVPGLLAAAAVFAGWRLRQVRQTAADHQARIAKQEEASRARSPEMLMRRLQVEPLSLTVGVGLGGVIGGAVGRQLQDRMQQLRERMLEERGFVLPALYVHDDSQLQPWEYRIAIRAATVATGTARPDRLLAIGGNLAGIDDAVPTTDPVFGAPAAWIQPSSRYRAELAGATVSDTPTILITHTAEVARRYAWRMLSREAVRQMVEQVRAQHPTVVQELVPDTLTLGDIQQVLQHLLRERVSVRDLPAILEALSDQARTRKDLPGLVQAARHALSGQITEAYVHEGRLPALVLDSAAERDLHGLLGTVDPEGIPPIKPEQAQAIWEAVRRARDQAGPGRRPVLLCGGAIRFALRRLLERTFPDLPVLAYTECSPDVTVDSLGVVRWGA